MLGVSAHSVKASAMGQKLFYYGGNNTRRSGGPVKPSRAVRAVVAALPFALSAVVVAAVHAAVRDRLPDPLATHFSGGGAPDGFSSAGSFLAVSVALLLGTGALLGGIGAWQRPGLGRWIVVTGWAAAGLLGSVLVSALRVNAAVADAHDARLPWWHIGVGCAVAAVAGGIGWLVVRGWTAESVAAGTVPERLALREGESAVWVRGAGSPQLGLIGGVLVLAGVAVSVPAGWIAAVALAAGGVLCLAFARVRVTAGARGVVVSPGALPWPRVRIPLDGIESASHRPLSALGEFGGWGYRIRPGRSGVILRSGDALVVRRVGGREFAVTVDDAATAAALLNALVGRGRGAQGASSC